MNKNEKKGTIIFLGIAVLLLLGAIVICSVFLKNNFEEISYSEYLEVIDKGKKVNFFIGDENSDSYKAVSNLAFDGGLKLYFIDSNKLTDEVKKELLGKKSSLFVSYNNKKENYKFNGDFTNYKFLINLMDNEIIDHKYVEVTIDEYLDIIKEKGYHFMFVGRTGCSYCDDFKDSINTAMKTNNFNAYYVDIANETITDNDLQKLYNSDSYFTEEDWGTPLNLLYKDGKRIDVLNGYVDSNQLVKFLQKNKVID